MWNIFQQWAHISVCMLLLLLLFWKVYSFDSFGMKCAVLCCVCSNVIVSQFAQFKPNQTKQNMHLHTSLLFVWCRRRLRRRHCYCCCNCDRNCNFSNRFINNLKVFLWQIFLVSQTKAKDTKKKKTNTPFAHRRRNRKKRRTKRYETSTNDIINWLNGLRVGFEPPSSTIRWSFFLLLQKCTAHTHTHTKKDTQ